MIMKKKKIGNKQEQKIIIFLFEFGYACFLFNKQQKFFLFDINYMFDCCVVENFTSLSHCFSLLL